MLFLYFSGTGNSKYIAELFCERMQSKIYSIEEDIAFEELITEHETIGFCYPIYGSRMPRIMNEFITKYKKSLHKKKIIIFCTQLLFSGDGARSLVDLLPKNHVNVIYAEHFIMPNNVGTICVLPITNGEKNHKYIRNAKKKMDIICQNIRNGVVFRRGFNPVSRLLGIEGELMPLIDKYAITSVKINKHCNLCGKCVHICPMRNLENMNGKIVQQSNCTFCYRCVNDCPQKAITVIFHVKSIRQYKGL